MALSGRVTYLVIDSVAVPRRRPQLAPLLSAMPFGEEDLVPVYNQERYGISVIVYKVKGGS